MRWAAAALVVLALAGCKREPTFDERYAAARRTIDANAKAIDAELVARESEAAMATEAGATASAKP